MMRHGQNAARRFRPARLAVLASMGAGGLALVTVLAGSAPPRTTSHSAAASNQAPEPDLSAQIFEALGLVTATLVPLDLDDTLGVPLTIVVPINGGPVTLELEPHTLRAATYEVLAQVATGELVPVEPAPSRTLRGFVPEIPGSAVAASLLPDGLHAMILMPDGARTWIQPVGALVEGAAENLHAVYHDTDVLPIAGECGVNEAWLAARQEPAGGGDGPLGGGGAGTGGCSQPVPAELACDADVEYFNDWGSVTAVENRINLIINTVNLEYEADVGITHEITTIIVRTSEPDPYTATADGLLLDQFIGEWTTDQAAIPRDVAHLFTGKNLDGPFIGVAAAIGAICSFSLQYCLAQSDCCGALACATDLTAHELGHLWDASHCNCLGFTMHTPLQCGNQFHPTFTIPGIIAHRNSRPCLDCPCPVLDDGLEENDLCASSVAIPIGTTTNLVVEDLDEDWYQLTLPALAQVIIDLTFISLFGDVDIELYDGCGGPIVASGVTNTNNESINYVNFGATRDFFLRVFLDVEVCNEYTMTVSLVLLNDDCVGNNPIVLAGVHDFSNLTATTDGPNELVSCNFNGDSQVQSDIWFRYFAQCTGQATVSLCGSGYDTKIAVYGADCPAGPGEVIACNNDSCGLQSEVSFPVTASTFYRIRIGGHLGAQGNGTMTITCVTPPPCPADTNGDGFVNVLDLIDLLLCFGQPAIPGCVGADINEDGTVNVLDLIELLLAFGTVCP